KNKPSVEKGMISNGAGIGVWRGWPGSRLGETARCTLLSGVTSSVTFAPRSEMPRAALANNRAVPDHSRAVCRNRTCKIRCSVTAKLQLVEPRVRAALRQQLGVRPLLLYFTTIEKHYLIGVRDRRQPMCNHEH